MEEPPLSPIGPEQAALLARRVSIIVGSRDALLRPHVVRALGARLSPDHRQLTLVLPQVPSRQVLADLSDNGRIAAVFSEPSTHRTIQAKGSDATLLPCTDEDRALAEHHLSEFMLEIGQLGFAREVALTSLGAEGGMVAVRFTVAEAFEQTPGPQAGAPLQAAGAR
jgi:hypothetical protein